MKVRDLKQYIGILTNGRSVISPLGSEDDLLLKEYAGKVENLDQHITDLPNFATDARTQIFYELMQNAEDAESESLHFFFDDHAILVLNNGLPFLTDSTKKGGQLFEFLFKGKGRKANNPNQIGEHGQGSKLLYSLILPNEYLGDKKEVVRKTLINDLIGPILFSWQRELDITQLCAWKDQPFEYIGNCEDLYFPLLAKVILTYYPAELDQVATLYDGREKELFSKTEMASLVAFLNKIRSKVTWTDFRRGTLLYIPLGEGQGEKMVNNWGGALRQGISISLDFLKHLKYVYVNGEQIRRSGLHVVQLANLTGGEKPVALQLAIPKVGERLPDKAINFFKFFPIVKATYGLNYLINTKAYDVGAARQEIDITDDNNKHILMDISVKIVEYIQKLREDGYREELIQFLRCVVHNEPKDPFFGDHFHAKLLLAFKENLPTKSGFADSATNVRIKKIAFPIQPEDLGISEWEWLDESLSDLYDQIERQLNVSTYTLTGLLAAAAANEKYKTWMAGLSDEYYQQLLEGIQNEVKEPSQLQNIRCWRFFNGEIYTLKEITEKESLILVLPEMQPLGLFLARGQVLAGGFELDRLNGLDQLIRRSIATLPNLMWDRITANLVTLESLTRDEKWAIFRVYHGNPVAQSHIASKLSIFLNTRGEKRALGQLSNQTAEWAPSGVLDMLNIRASEIIPEMQQYFIKKEGVWSYLQQTWQQVEALLLADVSNYKNKLLDLNGIQSANKTNQLLSDSNPWVLLPSGALAPIAEVFAQDALVSLSPEQYARLSDFIISNSDLKLVESHLSPVICSVTFAPLPHSGFSSLKSSLRESKIKINRDILEILPKIGKQGEGFFKFFTMQRSDIPTQYILSKNDKNITQYYTRDEKVVEFLEQQEGYCLIPKELLHIFEGDSTLKNEIKDDDFVLDLLNEFGAQRAFIDIVLNRENTIIKDRYLDKLTLINLSSGIEPSTYNGTFEFKTVKIIASHDLWITKYKSKVHIDGISITDFEYATEVKIDAVERSYNFSLARLLPTEFGDMSRKLDAVKIKMGGSSFTKLIKVDKYDPKKLAPKIKEPDAYQLAFLLVYYNYILESPSLWTVRSVLWNKVNKEDALLEFYDREMTFFSSFAFPEGWFNIHTAYATTEYDLLLEQEKVYPWILEWMKKGDDASNRKHFLTKAGLRGESDPTIEIRRKFRNEESFYEKDLENAFSTNVEGLVAIMNWIKNRFDIIELKSSRDISFRKILDYYWTANNGLPEVVPLLKKDTIGNKIHLQFNSPDWTKVRYITSLAGVEEQLWLDIIEREEYEFLYTSDSYGNKFREGLSLKKNILEARLIKSIDIPANESKVWDEKVYKVWKAEEKVDLNIFLLDHPVPFLCYFETGNVSVPIDSHENVKADRDSDNIYIHQEFPNENIYQVLSDQQEVLFKSDPDKLVRLLAKKLSASIEGDSLLTDDQKDKIRNNLELYQHIIDLPQADIQMLSQNADKILPMLKDGNLQNIIVVEDENLRNAISENLSIIGALADKDAFEVIGKLLERASKEQLEKLLDIWDEVEQELEKERSKPKPVALIGYLGERLVYLWLQNKELDPKNVQHVAKIEPAFDVLFNHNDHPYCVEVKTTIKSALEADNAIPFFLRASQYDFIQKNPDKDYIVFRLSLQDIGLTHLYDKYKVLGSDLNAILENSKDEIDEDLMAYINNENSVRRFKHNRMVFRMNIPKIDMEFWESF